MVKPIAIRRCVYWIVLTIGVIASILVRSPISPYVTIRGTVVGGNAYLYAAEGTSFTILLLWSAAYVRVEPLLVRVVLLVIGVPLCISMATELWRLITFTLHGFPGH